MSQRVYEACEYRNKEEDCHWEACSACNNGNFFKNALADVLGKLRYQGA